LYIGKVSSNEHNQPTASRSWRGAVVLMLTIWVVVVAFAVWHWRHSTQPSAQTPDDNQTQTSAQAPSSDSQTVAANRSTAPSGSLEEKVRSLLAEKNSAKRHELLNAITAQVTDQNLRSTLDQLRTLGLQDKDLNRRLLQRWAENDHSAAAAWALQLPESGSPEDTARAEALKTIAVELADEDLKTAMDWAAKLPASDSKNAALLAIANEAVRTDPLVALQLAVDLPADAPRDQLVERAAMEWASKDATAAVDWGKQISDEKLRNQVLAAIAKAWSQSDPAAAATMASKELSGPMQANAVVEIVQRWAQKQPQAAANWVAQFPPGDIKRAATSQLASLGIAIK